jgi:hypothetical protein
MILSLPETLTSNLRRSFLVKTYLFTPNFAEQKYVPFSVFDFYQNREIITYFWWVSTCDFETVNCLRLSSRSEPVNFFVKQGRLGSTYCHVIVSAGYCWRRLVCETDSLLKDYELSLKFFALVIFWRREWLLGLCSTTLLLTISFVRSLFIFFYRGLYIIFTQSDLRVCKQMCIGKAILLHLLRAPKRCGWCWKVVSPAHQPRNPQEIFIILIFVRGWIDPTDIVRQEGLWQWKILMIPFGNRTCDLPAFSLMPQTTVRLHTHTHNRQFNFI